MSLQRQAQIALDSRINSAHHKCNMRTIWHNDAAIRAMMQQGTMISTLSYNAGDVPQTHSQSTHPRNAHLYPIWDTLTLNG